MTKQTQTKLNKVCKTCETKGELKGDNLRCPECRAPIKHKKPLSELPDGIYRLSKAAAHSEIGQVPFARRFVFGHTEKGDHSKGLTETVENEEAYIKASKLLELSGKENSLVYGHSIWGTPLEEVNHMSDGDLLVTGPITKPKVFEKVVTVKLEGEEYEIIKEEMKQRKAFEGEMKDR